MMQEFTFADFETATQIYKERSADAILALQNGETTFSVDDSLESEIDALNYLEATLNWLHASNEHDFVQDLMEQLKPSQCQFASKMLQAHLSVLQGNLDQSVSQYQTVARSAPTRFEPLERMGHFLTERGRTDPAIESYLSALKLTMSPGIQIQIELKLVELLMNRKRFAEASKIYDRLLEIHPILGSDPIFSKQAAKAKKKAAADQRTFTQS